MRPRCSPRPCAMSWDRFSKLAAVKTVALCSAITFPSFVQPDVPELIANVLHASPIGRGHQDLRRDILLVRIISP